MRCILPGDMPRAAAYLVVFSQPTCVPALGCCPPGCCPRRCVSTGLGWSHNASCLTNVQLSAAKRIMYPLLSAAACLSHAQVCHYMCILSGYAIRADSRVAVRSQPTCVPAVVCCCPSVCCTQVCQYRCIVSYETPQFEQFALCILQLHNCRGLNAEIPMRPDPAPMTEWRGQSLTHETAGRLLRPQPAAAGGASQVDASAQAKSGSNCYCRMG
jgi:hypothetical protein